MIYDLSIIIPVYFNEESLDNLFQKLIILQNDFSKLDTNVQFIFVDDGSEDRSLLKLLKFKEDCINTKIIKLSRNFGAVLAAKEGFKHADGNCVTCLAADLQDPPENVIKMFKRWRDGKKFVACIRKNRNDGFFKTFTAKLFYILVRKFIIKNYPKQGYDMALIDSSLMQYILNGARAIHFPMQLYWLGYKPDIIYYERLKRPYGKSKWTPYKLVSTALDILLSFSPKFLQFLSFSGLLLSLLCFFYGIIVIISALMGNIPVPGYASIIVLNSFFFGILIFYLSIIQEYLWRIFVDITKTSEVIVDEIFN